MLISQVLGGLEYIGQRGYGCVLFWCDGPSYTEYYFATDMTEDQLKQYFKGAQFVDIGLGGDNPDYYYNELKFATTSGHVFYIDYYHGIGPSRIEPGLKNTNKAYGISIKDSDYRIAKQAL